MCRHMITRQMSHVPSTRGLCSKPAHEHLLAIYSDRAILVLNKPPGLETQLRKEDSVLRDILTGLKEGKKDHELPHAFPVHRLDKGTTGVLLCGKTKSAVTDLTKQFKARTVEKEYLALVRGGKTSFENTLGTMENWWHKEQGYVSVSEEMLDPSDKLATTSWELLATSPIAPLSLVKLCPKTGYKHQLRAQLDAMNIPILGDARYSTDVHPSISEVMKILNNTYLYLHAVSASFHRYQKLIKPRRFRLGIMAPLPAYFKEVCTAFEIPLDKKYITGGVYVNGTLVESGLVEGIDGKWLL